MQYLMIIGKGLPTSSPDKSVTVLTTKTTVGPLPRTARMEVGVWKYKNLLSLFQKEKKSNFIFTDSSWERRDGKTFLIRWKLLQGNVVALKSLLCFLHGMESTLCSTYYVRAFVSVALIVMAQPKNRIASLYMFTCVQIGLGKWGRCYYISTQPMIAFGQKRLSLSLFLQLYQYCKTFLAQFSGKSCQFLEYIGTHCINLQLDRQTEAG